MTTTGQGNNLAVSHPGPFWRNLEKIGPGDIVISSIAVSGQAIVNNILIELGLNLIDAMTEEIYEDGSVRPVDAALPLRQQFSGMARLDTSEDRDVRAKPRFIRTHAFSNELGAARYDGAWLVVRDPRDAIYSKFQMIIGLKGMVDDYYRDFGEWLVDVSRNVHMPTQSLPDWRRNPIASWTEFHRGWLQRSTDGLPVVVSRFEELKSRPVEEMRTALRVFGVEVDDETLELAVERSSYEAMRAHEDAVLAGTSPGRPTQQNMRRGKVGEWAEWMTPRLAELFAKEDVRNIAGRLGYSV